jgi:hypothetical protein
LHFCHRTYPHLKATPDLDWEQLIWQEDPPEYQTGTGGSVGAFWERTKKTSFTPLDAREIKKSSHVGRRIPRPSRWSSSITLSCGSHRGEATGSGGSVLWEVASFLKHLSAHKSFPFTCFVGNERSATQIFGYLFHEL